MPKRIATAQMPVMYSVIVLFVIAFALAASGVFYTQRVQADTKAEIAESEEERDRNLCGVINASLGIEPGKPIPAPPPATTPRGQRVVKEMLDLRAKLKCPS